MEISIFNIVSGISAFFGFVWFYLHNKDYDWGDVVQFNKKHEADLASKKQEIIDEHNKKSQGAFTDDPDKIVFIKHRNRHKKYAIISILFGISIQILLGILPCFGCVIL